MNKYTLISIPKLSAQGGVSSYWNSILPELTKKLNIQVIETGGNKRNILGPIFDQISFYSKIKNKPSHIILNPSLRLKSFFRDAFFAKNAIKQEIPFIVFFHGWNLNFEKKISQYFKSFFLNSFGKADMIIVLSQSSKNKLLEWGYKGQIVIETTSIDSSLLKRFSIDKKFPIIKDAEKITILFLARLIKEKGIYELLEAFNNLEKKYTNIELIIAGDGKEYNQIVKQTSRNKNIKVVGHIEGNKKINCFENASIYCLPSYSEGLPTTILEAMAFGTAIITTPVGGLKDFFKDGSMGYFVPVKNTTLLENKIESLINNKEKRIQIAKYNHKQSINYLNTVIVDRIYHYISELKG